MNEKERAGEQINMCGNLNQQAQQFLEGIFGQGHKYVVEDGVYGEWMNIVIDDAVLHIEIEKLEPLALRIIRVTFYVEEDELGTFGPVEDILEDAPSYGIEWELAMMEFGTVMIDIKSNYDTEDEGLMDEEIIPNWNEIKNVINEIKKTITSNMKKTTKKDS